MEKNETEATNTEPECTTDELEHLNCTEQEWFERWHRSLLDG